MRLTIKNRLMSRHAYDEDNKRVCVVKKHFFHPRKTVVSADGSAVYETTVTLPHRVSRQAASDLGRQYAIYRAGDAGDAGDCLATAKPAYAPSVDLSALQQMSFKPPLIDRMTLHFTKGKTPIDVHMQKDSSFRMIDSNGNLVGTIQPYRLFKGHRIDVGTGFNPAFTLALFELTRYLIQENEVDIV